MHMYVESADVAGRSFCMVGSTISDDLCDCICRSTCTGIIRLGEVGAVGEIRRTDPKKDTERRNWVNELPPPRPYRSLDRDSLASEAPKTHVGRCLSRAGSAVCLVSSA